MVRMSLGVMFFFFKQKTAYDMRISDWSSDVCSSDLLAQHGLLDAIGLGTEGSALQNLAEVVGKVVREAASQRRGGKDGCAIIRCLQIGRASCRESVCQ